VRRLIALILAAILSVFAPITHAIVKVKVELSIVLAAVLPTLFSAPTPPATGPPDPALLDLPADPGLPLGQIFINKLLVLGSQVGLVQLGSPTNYLGGFGYSPESYLKVTQVLPGAGVQYVEGIAVTSGVVHIVDASFELPLNVQFVGGLPLTPTGQLCVVFG